MRISDWSSDVCSSDLKAESPRKIVRTIFRLLRNHRESKGLERAARSWKADKRRSLRRRCTLCSAPVWRPFRTLRLARRRCNGTTVASSRSEKVLKGGSPSPRREKMKKLFTIFAMSGSLLILSACNTKSEEHQTELP